ncbi:MAG: DUF1036 domain-containing protein [Alphaproteobacteria bacterium]|nr:DUF1036 domain-containing protein [Alphaproteobacteria bacterium]MBL6937561.1 DUF1036 domain-containing protein [Alphaproteobacteria bacterium]MBL7098899.1 DUF1036 domain-containing protein [Alphaproteobacteria bacterium]
MRVWCAFLGVLALATLATPATASMKVCNRTSYVLYTATASDAHSGINSQGWARVAPGDCRVALPADLSAPAYYIYARTSRAHSGAARAWGGDKPICVKDTNFATQNAFSARDCLSDDFYQLPFALVDTHHLRSWTTTFSESPALATLQQAQIAGFKRLLQDLGYRIAAVDGKPDPAADGALVDFRKRMRIAPNATIDDLFDALETEALKTATPSGYSVCNDTAKAVAAALAQRQGTTWVAHGWWKIGAGSCAKLVAELGSIDSLYLFVQKVNGPPLVTGKEKFCVADIQFDIEGRTNCGKRGLTEIGFLETKVRGLPGFSAHVGEQGLVKPLPRQAPRR